MQFDLYRNEEENADFFPYVLDVTNELHHLSKLRGVIPLCSDGAAVTHLNPTFTIEGRKLYLSTMDIAGVPAGMLQERVANLADRRNEIVDAVDFLIHGF